MKRLGYLFVWTITLLVLNACNTKGDTAECDSRLPDFQTWKIPAYPTTVKPLDKDYSINSISPMIFETSDDANKVLTYYKEILGRGGWLLDQPSSGSKEVIFRIVNCCKRMWLSINTESISGGQTKVILQPGWGMACV